MRKQYRALRSGDPAATAENSSGEGLKDRARRIIADRDDRGRWISVYQSEPLMGQPKIPEGSQYITSAVFSQNPETLDDYVTATGHSCQ